MTREQLARRVAGRSSRRRRRRGARVSGHHPAARFACRRRVLPRSMTSQRSRAISSERTEQEFFVSRFVDYSSEDRTVSQVPVVFVEGRPYACHMAIADRWDIWYLNAGMSESAAKRLEEETFMRTFEIGFARRHRSALADMAARIGLDYFTIDCAETKRRRVVDIRGRQHRGRAQHGYRRTCFPTSRRKCASFSMRSRRCCSVAAARAAGAGRVKAAARAGLQVRIEPDARSAGLGRASRARSSHAR